MFEILQIAIASCKELSPLQFCGSIKNFLFIISDSVKRQLQKCSVYSLHVQYQFDTWPHPHADVESGLKMSSTHLGLTVEIQVGFSLCSFLCHQKLCIAHKGLGVSVQGPTREETETTDMRLHNIPSDSKESGYWSTGSVLFPLSGSNSLCRVSGRTSLVPPIPTIFCFQSICCTSELRLHSVSLDLFTVDHQDRPILYYLFPHQ